MKTTLSIAILALIGQSSAIQLDRQVTADDYDGMGEYTLVHEEPVVIKSTDLKNSAEPDAFESKKAREKKEKDEAALVNPFDGTTHHKNGTRTFSEDVGGGIVGGVNKFVQIKSAHKKHHKHHKKDVKEEDSQAETDQKAKDVADVKKEAEVNAINTAAAEKKA